MSIKVKYCESVGKRLKGRGCNLKGVVVPIQLFIIKNIVFKKFYESKNYTGMSIIQNKTAKPLF